MHEGFIFWEALVVLVVLSHDPPVQNPQDSVLTNVERMDCGAQTVHTLATPDIFNTINSFGKSLRFRVPNLQFAKKSKKGRVFGFLLGFSTFMAHIFRWKALLELS